VLLSKGENLKPGSPYFDLAYYPEHHRVQQATQTSFSHDDDYCPEDYPVQGLSAGWILRD
jgi:hypothetical protein